MGAANGLRAVTSRYLWLALCALAVSAFVLLGYVVWAAYRTTWEEARVIVRDQASLVEARLDSTFRRIDANLADLAADIPEAAWLPGREEVFRSSIEARMARHRRLFPEVAGFRIIDKSGQVRYLTGGADYPRLDDRPYFISARDVPGDGLVFSEVIESRITGTSVMVVARAIRRPDGEFLGVVSAAVEMANLERQFAAGRSGGTVVIAVRRSDSHALVVRQPPVPKEINRGLDSTHSAVIALAAGQREGVLSFAAAADGVRRIYAFRKLENFPFYVLAGLSEAEAMATWRQRALAVGGVGGALFLCLGIVLYALFRAQTRAHEAAAALVEQRQQLREAQRLAKVGSWELDLTSNRLTWTDELFQIFELDTTTPISYALFLSYVHPDDRDLIDKNYRESVSNRSAYDVEHRILMPDGRVKYVRECGETIFDDTGVAIRSIGTAQDVTGHRQMEAKMQLLGSAFQHSSEAPD